MKYRVMAERITYTPFFKVFEAASQEDAETQAAIQVEGLAMRQELSDLGWGEGDDSVEYEVRPDVTEALESK